MKKAVQVLGILFVCIFIWACPYESRVPIARASIPVDKQLLGTWETSNPDDDYMVITKGGDNEYNIFLIERGKNRKDEYKGFVTVVNKVKFMNIYWTKDNETRYSFYKFDLQGTTLKTVAVSDKIKEVFNTSFELRDYVIKHLGKASFYEESENVFTRK